MYTVWEPDCRFNSMTTKEPEKLKRGGYTIAVVVTEDADFFSILNGQVDALYCLFNVVENTRRQELLIVAAWINPAFGEDSEDELLRMNERHWFS